MVRIVAVVACVSCWSGSEPTAVTSAPLANNAPVSPRPVGARRSIWEGHYTCRQGETALRLSLERNDDRIDAVFEFGPLASNPNVPHGRFNMTGSATRTADGIVVDLTPTDWIEQPPTYVTVGIHGVITEGRVLRGQIDGPGCSDIEVTRID